MQMCSARPLDLLTPTLGDARACFKRMYISCVLLFVSIWSCSLKALIKRGSNFLTTSRQWPPRWENLSWVRSIRSMLQTLMVFSLLYQQQAAEGKRP